MICFILSKHLFVNKLWIYLYLWRYKNPKITEKWLHNHLLLKDFDLAGLGPHLSSNDGASSLSEDCISHSFEQVV